MASAEDSEKVWTLCECSVSELIALTCSLKVNQLFSMCRPLKTTV